MVSAASIGDGYVSDWHGWDTESENFRPGYMAPRTVCSSFAAPGERATWFPTDEVWEHLYRVLKRKTPLAVMNAAYDACCVIAWGPAEVRELLLEAYEEDRILDLTSAQRALEIAGITRTLSKFETNLERFVQFWGIHKGPVVEKHDGTRENFGPLLGAPRSAYTDKQTHYIKRDAIWHRDVAHRQFATLERAGYAQAKPGICMLSRDLLWCMRTSNTGMTCDPERVRKLERALEIEITRLKKQAIESGFVRDANGQTRGVDPSRPWAKKGKPGAKNTGAIQDALRKCGSPYKTKTGYSTSKEALSEADSKSLQAFAKYGTLTYVQNKDLKVLKRGAVEPIHCRFNIANSLRLLAEKPNMQNWARDAMMLDGEEHAVRDCFTSGPGWCYLSADFEGLETVSVAEVIVQQLKRRHLADQILGNVDILSTIAAEIAGKSYDWVLKNKYGGGPAYYDRQASKATLYGMLGGMSNPNTLKSSAKKSYNVLLEIAKVRQVMKAVFRAQPDVKHYLRWVHSLPQNRKGYKMILTGGRGLYRRDTSYPAIANTGFQTMGSRISGATGWRLMRETLDEDSALFGAHLCAYIHDEFMIEVRQSMRTEAALLFQKIMHEAPSAANGGPLKHMRIGGKVVCMKRWNKHAEQKFDKRGEIVIC